jgi:cell wall-associated NlpC family hydrolase
MTSPEPIYVADLTGKPFLLGGRGPESYDCAGLVVEVLRRQGIDLSIPSTPGSRDDQFTSMREILATNWIPIPRAVPGCLVYFKGLPGHVGVMLTAFTFIHVADAVDQVCIERLEGSVWPRRFAGFYEYGGGL